MLASGGISESRRSSGLTKPPRGIALITQSVPFLSVKRAMRGPKPTEKVSTRMPNARMARKCPHSWKATMTTMVTIKASTVSMPTP